MNETNQKTCYFCGNSVEVENGVQWGSYFYCDTCFKNNKCSVDSYHHPSLPVKFKKLDGEETKEFLGIELETTKDKTGFFYSSDHVDDIFYIRKHFKNIGRNINFETDSSIGNGKELVFFPMTYNYIKSNSDELKDMFSYLISKGNYSHDGGKCGLHIHVSKDYLGDTQEEIQKTIEKLMLFIETYRDKVERFSRRKHNEFSHYNTYTIPNHKANYNDTCFTDDNYFKSGKILYDLNKYDCIGHSSVLNTNTSTGVTVEFRMFRGTLRYETFMATIEFIHNLVNVCKENAASKISWNKVINYDGDFIKKYNESLDIIDDGLYLRDYTSQIEETIKKRNEAKKETIDKYKKDLNDIADALQAIINEPIDFTADNQIIRDTINFRNYIFDTISANLLSEDNNIDNGDSLYLKLKNIGTDYNDKCKAGLTNIQKSIKKYTNYNLSEATKGHAKDVINLIKDKLDEIGTEVA